MIREPEPTPAEAAHRKKWWAIGNWMLGEMRKKNEHLWKVKKKPKQTMLDL